jgi:hypothetical protein
MPKTSLANDGRLKELLRLGRVERDLTHELVEIHEQIAVLASALLPPHASESQISEVVAASGYSRTLIDALRGGNHPWNRPYRA